MKRAILDTDTLSYIIKRRYPSVDASASQYLRVFRYFSVSVISIAEIVEGFEIIRDHSAAADFLERSEGFELVPVGDSEAVLAGRILGALRRTGLTIGELDPFIAATAFIEATYWLLATQNTIRESLT